MKLFKMAATIVTSIVTVAAALILPSPLAAEGATEVPVNCQSPGVQKAEVTAADTTVTVTCASSSTDFKPAISTGVTNVLIGPNCDDEQPLSVVCPSATGSKQDSTVKFQIPKLPLASRQFCLICGKGENKNCTAQVYVKVPVAQGGPQVCETPGGSITLNIAKSGDHALFSCAYGLYLTPTNANKVFAEDCKKEEDLQDLTLAKDANGYTVTATKNPGKKKLCYLCGPKSLTKTKENESTFCSVYIHTGAAARSLFHIGVSLTLPCVLALLHIS